eukprot:TRINITY_DN41870_c0_g2_i1.p1 TRINITY_DN41870_c0_g2~~TRINITY_DN41870_c0_g2_i1.p1  ORF type:complete len:259 (+),score=43.85 TRINITY_DN41870_c0_g2_i1:86-778(+)
MAESLSWSSSASAAAQSWRSSSEGSSSDDESSSTSQGSGISKLVQMRFSMILGAVGVLQEQLVECRRTAAQISSDSPWAPFEIPASSSGGSSGATAQEMKDFLCLLLEGIPSITTPIDCINQVAILVEACRKLVLSRAPFTEASWKPLVVIAMVASLRILDMYPAALCAVSERNMQHAVEGWWTLSEFEIARRAFELLAPCQALEEAGPMRSSEGYSPGNACQRSTKLSL